VSKMTDKRAFESSSSETGGGGADLLDTYHQVLQSTVIPFFWAQFPHMPAVRRERLIWWVERKGGVNLVGFEDNEAKERTEQGIIFVGDGGA